MHHFVTLEHRTSLARRSVELLRFCKWRAWIWWPLCGVYAVDLEGATPTGQLFDVTDDDQLRRCASQWQLVPSDVKRLRRRRPLSLYQSVTADPDE
jgi:hypothetical protein